MVSLLPDKKNSIKVLVEVLPTNIPDLEEPWHICILTKANRNAIGPTTDVSKFSPGFMLQIYFSFFIIESIRGLTSNFVATCSANSYPFGFPSRSKRPHLDILTFIVNTLSNQYKKVSLVWVDEDGVLSISSEFMNTCHNRKIIVKTTGGDASSLNGKIESPNKTLDNITRSLLINSYHNKELWCFAYQYSIWLSCRTENVFCGDVAYFLWHGTRPLYKHIKIWGVIVYIINGCDAINSFDDR